MYMVGSTDIRLHAMTARQNRVLLLWTAKIAHVRNGYETQCIIVSSAMQSIIQKSYSAKLIRAVPRLRWMLWLMMLCRDCGR